MKKVLFALAGIGLLYFLTKSNDTTDTDTDKKDKESPEVPEPQGGESPKWEGAYDPSDKDVLNKKADEKPADGRNPGGGGGPLPVQGPLID